MQVDHYQITLLYSMCISGSWLRHLIPFVSECPFNKNNNKTAEPAKNLMATASLQTPSVSAPLMSTQFFAGRHNSPGVSFYGLLPVSEAEERAVLHCVWPGDAFAFPPVSNVATARRKGFGRSENNPSSKGSGRIRTCTCMWSSTI